MMRRTRLNPKRATPRRDEGRVQHGRSKPKAGAAPNAEEKRHLASVARRPCMICGKPGPSTVHHVRHKVTGGGAFDRNHRRVVPLCPACHFHDHGPASVERIHEAGVFERFGIDLWAQAERLWSERE
jgi:5-methylcytosine-specific restriction endonuclease McrA